jgi:DNA-binding protein WhiA
MLKEELSKIHFNILEKKVETLAYIEHSGQFSKDKIIIVSENASVIRKIYENIKEVFSIKPSLIIRKEPNFKKSKQTYIIEIKNRIDFINHNLADLSDMLASNEEKVAYLEGTFLAVGSISDPKTSGYHLEFVFKNKEEAEKVNNLLLDLNFNSKIVLRLNKYIVYLKSSEEISDLLKLFKVFNSLFYFEDIRIYRDHKNMVNRLNNCEIANQEKTLRTGMKQVEYINYIKENNAFKFLEENTKLIAESRLKHPEHSYLELQKVLEKEYDYKIGKSGINHHFIKIKKLYDKLKSKEG